MSVLTWAAPVPMEQQAAINIVSCTFMDVLEDVWELGADQASVRTRNFKKDCNILICDPFRVCVSARATAADDTLKV